MVSLGKGFSRVSGPMRGALHGHEATPEQTRSEDPSVRAARRGPSRGCCGLAWSFERGATAGLLLIITEL